MPRQPTYLNHASKPQQDFIWKKAALALASGAAAICYTLQALAQNRGHIVAQKTIYGGSYNLLANTLHPFGISCTFVDIHTPEETEAAIRPETKAIYVKSMGYPNCDIPDIAAPHPSYHGLSFASAVGPAAFVTYLRAILLRDMGACISPFAAFQLLQGMETLSLRIERHGANTEKVVQYLNAHPQVVKVNHPHLPSHPNHEIYCRYYPNRGGSVFTLEIKGGQKAAFRFINALKLFSLVANVADMKSLVIHPASTTHSQLSPEQLAECGITPGTIRLSIGTEHIDDILADLEQAFAELS